MPSLVLFLDTIWQKKRNRNLYNALSGRMIYEQPFWQAFTDSAQRRNAAVHRGASVAKEEAEDTQRVATELVAYLEDQ